MKRVVIGLVIAVGLVAAVAFTVLQSRPPAPPTYKVEFDNAFGLAEGGDLKIAGVRAGQTTKFDVGPAPRRLAVVTFEVNEPGVGRLREDAKCISRPQSLIGEYYVDCTPGNGRALRPGSTIPVKQTTSTIPIDLVNNILRLPYRERLRLIIAELGTGLAGRPADLAEVLRRAHPGLRETSRTLRTLGRQRATIERFIVDAERVVTALERRKGDVTRFVDEAGETARVTASRREELRRNFALLPRTLDEMRPYMARLGNLADEQIPLLTDLERAGPPLNEVLTQLGPFARASRPAFRGLGRASSAGTDAFRAASQEVRALRNLARRTPRLSRPLRQLLESLDDRRRAVKNDPRAKATGPPAGDKTHIPAGRQGGFTGFEALFNYAYWQALAVNGRDGIGHVLRIVGITDDCANYFASNKDDPETPMDEAAIFRRCNQFLGPNQPGITTPDPTRTGRTTSRAARRASAGRGRQRPAAPSAPQQDRQVEPQPATPAPPRSGSSVEPQPGGTPSDDALLDFLLGP